jgi:hypothetical protein
MGHRGVDRVLGLGPVDGDDQNPVPLFDEDFGFAGSFFSAHGVHSAVALLFLNSTTGLAGDGIEPLWLG